MNEPVLLFVYGTLMTDGEGYRALELEGKARSLGGERIHGTLYDIGDYPGCVCGGGGVVEGELLALDDPDLLPRLDDYEGYLPEDHRGCEYVRVKVQLLGSGREAWCYDYRRPLTGRPVIAGGRWRNPLI